MLNGLYLVILAAILWGTAGLTAKFVIEIYPLSPLTIGAWRLLIASPALLFITRVKDGGWEVIKKKDIPYFVIYGITVAAYQITYFAAVKFTFVSTATLIAICTSPLFVAFLSKIFLKERIAKSILAALTLSIFGTVLVINPQSFALFLNSRYLIGYLLALAAGFSYASYAVAGKKLVHDYKPLSIISVTFTLGAIFMLPFIRFPGDMPLKGWLFLIYLGLIPTAVAYILFTQGLLETSVTKAAIASLLEPLTSTVLAVLLVGERLTITQSIGAVLLLSALFVISVE